MNTKTMRLPPRRLLTPTKRKERDDIDAPKPASTKRSLKPTSSQLQAGSEKAESEPDSSNQLLAGYLAHEYLTKGTLFGQPFDPARPQTVKPPVVKVTTTTTKRRKIEGAAEKEEEEEIKNRRRYAEVASLLKTDGAHIAGIVNPTQLARFLHM